MKSAFTILLIAITLSCTTSQMQELDYCLMLEKDQTLPARDEKDKEKAKRIRKERKQSFLDNFELLVSEAKRNGFPKIDKNTLVEDSCLSLTVKMTFIHMAQAHPEVLFTNENIELIETAVHKETLSPKFLQSLFFVSFASQDFCESLKPNIDLSIQKWNIDTTYCRTPRYVSCKNGKPDFQMIFTDDEW